MSRKGFSILAGNCGFTLGAITDVGYAWSLMSSELYAKGDHIGPGEGYSDHFSRREMASFRRKSMAANAAGRGDIIAGVSTRQ